MIDINIIIKKTLGEIEASREQILDIADSLRGDQNKFLLELESIRAEIEITIIFVDDLEKQDKLMRQKLAEVSKNFNTYSEEEVRKVYEKASEIRINFFAKRQEEKVLKDRRDKLEMDLKNSMVSVEKAEKVINQISIAIGYLEGNFASDKNSSEVGLGIKILEAQETERKRIARDIHDGPAQHMANAVMKVDVCRMIMEKNKEKGFEELLALKEGIKRTLKEVRGIIFNLRPIALNEVGLIETIKEIGRDISMETGIDIDFLLKPLKDEIETMIQIAVYRIVQELLNNIKKYAKAKNVMVKLDYGSEYLILNVTDDGIGFQVENTIKQARLKGDSYGLLGVIDRVEQLQGEINIESKIGKGTATKIKLPVSYDKL